MTLIFQGPWDKYCTEESFCSVFSWHKGRTIFSTWIGQRPPQKSSVEYLYLPDCGAGPVQNLKRQVYGLRKALESVPDDEVVFKMRSDMFCFENPLNFFSLEKCSDVFQYKVGISVIMTRDPLLFPYYVSDWIWIGIASDLKRIASIDIDKCQIDKNAGAEFNWARGLASLFSKTENGQDFLRENYIPLKIKSQINCGSNKYLNNSEDGPIYIRI